MHIIFITSSYSFRILKVVTNCYLHVAAGSPLLPAATPPLNHVCQNNEKI
jgi:hypothetical protein